MAIDVTVLRVFTDQDGSFGNPLGVVDASQAEPSQRQLIATELGYSETVFIDVPAPEFAIYDLESTDELFAADPEDYPDDIQNYLWTWTDRERGAIRSRMFAANLGVPEDEATGAAAVRITDYLSRDLTILQGKGSVIHTQWSPEGWVRIAGRVVNDGIKQID